MSAAAWLLIVSVLFAVIAFLCWKLSRLHLRISEHCRCISQMLLQPEDAQKIAADSRDDLMRRKLW